ncbi:hypothetical protein LINPERPRIM_LOCUS38965 [Linum perenne]
MVAAGATTTSPPNQVTSDGNVNLVIMLANCNGLNQSKVVTVGTLVLGMLTTVLSVLYSALRAGSSTTFLSPSPPSSPRASGDVLTWTSKVTTGSKPLLGDEEMEEGKGKEKETECRPVSYSYSFFHLIFALASMY